MTPSWTICIHVTVKGAYEDAERVAEALEKISNREGAANVMIEILEQASGR